MSDAIFATEKNNRQQPLAKHAHTYFPFVPPRRETDEILLPREKNLSTPTATSYSKIPYSDNARRHQGKQNTRLPVAPRSDTNMRDGGRARQRREQKEAKENDMPSKAYFASDFHVDCLGLFPRGRRS